MQIITNENQKELKSHGDFAFPVNVSEEVLHNYERGSFLWHWHPEIELTLFTEGEMIYQVNNQSYHIKAGDGLFCNSNALHAGYMVENNNCHYISITFHPRMVYGYDGSSLYQNYVKPIIKSQSLGSYLFHENVKWENNILLLMKEIYELYFQKNPLYEFKIQKNLTEIWISFYDNYVLKERVDLKDASTNRDVDRLRTILTYLEENYADKITLEDIADKIGLCKAECCRFFKRMMNKSLFDYILYYRIERSLPLLTQKNLSITEIAEQTGFSSSSYYARVFKEQLGYSPTEYRKNVG